MGGQAFFAKALVIDTGNLKQMSLDETDRPFIERVSLGRARAEGNGWVNGSGLATLLSEAMRAIEASALTLLLRTEITD
jgi:hypothetical protein